MNYRQLCHYADLRGYGIERFPLNSNRYEYTTFLHCSGEGLFVCHSLSEMKSFIDHNSRRNSLDTKVEKRGFYLRRVRRHHRNFIELVHGTTRKTLASCDSEDQVERVLEFNLLKVGLQEEYFKRAKS